MFLVTLVSKAATPTDLSPLVKAVKNGLSIEESCIVFSISPSSLRDDAQIIASGSHIVPSTPSSAFFQTHSIASTPHMVELVGDATMASAACLDTALWKIGGAAICLRLVQLAHVSLICLLPPLPPSRSCRIRTSSPVLSVYWPTACAIIGRILKTWSACVCFDNK